MSVFLLRRQSSLNVLGLFLDQGEPVFLTCEPAGCLSALPKGLHSWAITTDLPAWPPGDCVGAGVKVRLLGSGLGLGLCCRLGLAVGPGAVLRGALMGCGWSLNAGQGGSTSSASLNTEPWVPLRVLCGHMPAGCFKERLPAGPWSRKEERRLPGREEPA